MEGYIILPLLKLKETAKTEIGGEERLKSILSSFSCPRNPDIEFFLRTKALVFEEQALARTYLVVTTYREKHVLIGYFTIAANKSFTILKKAISSSLRNRIKKFGTYDANQEGYNVAAPLIAQLGKNYNNGYDKLITGAELLDMALEKVRTIQNLGGGKVVYLECEDKPRLIDFYSRNGFCSFGKRLLDVDEVGKFEGKHLIQMLRYLG